MRQKHLAITIASLLTLVPALGGCKDNQDVVTLRGRLSPKYTIAAAPSLLDKAMRLVIGTAHASDPALKVSKLVAVPNPQEGINPDVLPKIKTFTLESDGTFSIALDKATRWVLLLVDGSKGVPKNERIVGYATLKVDSDGNSLVSAPLGDATESTLDLGQLDPKLDEAVSSNVVNSFSLTPQELSGMAQADDAFKHVGNAWLNYNATAKTYYEVNSLASWSGPLSKLIGTLEPSIADYRFDGLQLSVATNDLPGKFAGICDGSVAVKIQPPTSVTVVGGATYSRTKPLQNTAMQLWDSDNCGNDALGVRRSSRGLFLQFPTGGGLLDAVPEGYWSLSVGGSARAVFDAASAPPQKGGKILVPIPMPYLSRLTPMHVAVTWWVWSPSKGTYAAIPASALEKVFASSFVSTNAVGGKNGGKEALYYFREPGKRVVRRVDLPEKLNTNRYQRTPDEAHLDTLGVGYTIGGNTYKFSWTFRCGDRKVGPGEECDGPVDKQTCRDAGYLGGEASCHPATCTIVHSKCTVGNWSAGGNLAQARHSPMAVTLTDGRVLIVGGADRADNDSKQLFTAEIYDPTTNKWSSAGSIPSTFRFSEHSDVLLAIGSNRALLVAVSRAALYDAKTNRWTTHSAGMASRHLPTVAVSDGFLQVSDTTAWHFSTATMSRTVINSNLGQVRRINGVATVLLDGRVLVTGGYAPGNSATVGHKSAFVIDPNSGQTAPSGDDAEGRWGHSAVPLADGRVLMLGSRKKDSSGDLTWIKSSVWDPSTKTFTALPNSGVPRGRHDLVDLGSHLLIIKRLEDPSVQDLVGALINKSTLKFGHIASKLGDPRWRDPPKPAAPIPPLSVPRTSYRFVTAGRVGLMIGGRVGTITKTVTASTLVFTPSGGI